MKKEIQIGKVRKCGTDPFLENRAIRARYTAKRFPDGNKDHVIVDFLVKKTNGQLATGSQLDRIW